jgi:hypothetical protein
MYMYKRNPICIYMYSYRLSYLYDDNGDDNDNDENDDYDDNDNDDTYISIGWRC